MIMAMKKYPQRRDHLRNRAAVPRAVGSCLTILGLAIGLNWYQDVDQTRPPVDLEAKPTLAPDAQYWNAYDNCSISYPRLDGVENGVAHIALQLNTPRNVDAKQAAEKDKVHYVPTPRAVDPRTDTWVNNLSIFSPLADGPNEATLTVSMAELGLSGDKNVDVFVEATDELEKNGVRQYCGRMAVEGTNQSVTLVELRHSDPADPSPLPARQRFDPQG